MKNFDAKLFPVDAARNNEWRQNVKKKNRKINTEKANVKTGREQ